DFTDSAYTHHEQREGLLQLCSLARQDTHALIAAWTQAVRTRTYTHTHTHTHTHRPTHTHTQFNSIQFNFISPCIQILGICFGILHAGYSITKLSPARDLHGRY